LGAYSDVGRRLKAERLKHKALGAYSDVGRRLKAEE